MVFETAASQQSNLWHMHIDMGIKNKKLMKTISFL